MENVVQTNGILPAKGEDEANDERTFYAKFSLVQRDN
jgi:hypothetical protein